MSWIWQRLCSGKLWFLGDSCRQCLLAALSCELAWSRSDSPQPENAYGESERLGLMVCMNPSDGKDPLNITPMVTHWIASSPGGLVTSTTPDASRTLRTDAIMWFLNSNILWLWNLDWAFRFCQAKIRHVKCSDQASQFQGLPDPTFQRRFNGAFLYKEVAGENYIRSDKFAPWQVKLW